MKNPFAPKTVELTDQERRETVENILADCIILERVFYVIKTLNQVGSINEKECNTWDASDNINSIANTWHLMGLTHSFEDEKLGDQLSDVFYNTYSEEMRPGFKRDASVVAGLIYTEWLDLVIKYNRNKLLQKSN